ncbi:MAG TPA: (2Fe-2S)-binding protein [Candidatus Dietzia intestinipullorum]|nr:(2Fe-2S)-binding protein [Candidatus Dietzia intestinipullorum]
MPDPVTAAYERLAGPLGEFARTIDHGPQVLPGSVLADPRWLSDRIEDTGRRWAHGDRRVNGTLWWYSASSTLVAPPLTMLLTEGAAPDPRPEHLEVSLQPNGYLRAARSARLLTSAAEFADALRQAHEEVIAALAEVSGASPRALWAIASDSIGNRALEAGRAVGDPERGCALAHALTAPPLLPVRYVDVDGPQRSRRFLRRGSCCLIYVATDGEKCVSCPRRTPDDRHAALVRRTAS